MNKPDFLPFLSTDFSRHEALVAGLYLLQLDQQTGNGDLLTSREIIKQELTGFSHGVGRQTETQCRIIRKVANTLGGLVVDRRNFKQEDLIAKIEETIDA